MCGMTTSNIYRIYFYSYICAYAWVYVRVFMYIGVCFRICENFDYRIDLIPNKIALHTIRGQDHTNAHTYNHTNKQAAHISFGSAATAT